MELLSLIIALAKSGIPLPDFSDKEQLQGWIIENADEVAALVAYFAGKADVTEAQDEVAEVLASTEIVEKIGDGAILKWLTDNLPTILQLLPIILPLFLNKDDDTDDETDPEPTPDVV